MMSLTVMYTFILKLHSQEMNQFDQLLRSQNICLDGSLARRRQAGESVNCGWCWSKNHRRISKHSRAAKSLCCKDYLFSSLFYIAIFLHIAIYHTGAFFSEVACGYWKQKYPVVDLLQEFQMVQAQKRLYVWKGEETAISCLVNLLPWTPCNLKFEQNCLENLLFSSFLCCNFLLPLYLGCTPFFDPSK